VQHGGHGAEPRHERGAARARDDDDARVGRRDGRDDLVLPGREREREAVVALAARVGLDARRGRDEDDGVDRRSERRRHLCEKIEGRRGGKGRTRR
jgi:hypothetical protein